MSTAEPLLPEFGQEMATTRRLLERVPSDRGSWKPHEKSFPLGHLAQLVARMPEWITNAAREASWDLAHYRPYSFEPTEMLLAEFDRHVSEAEEALRTVSDEDRKRIWSLRRGDQVFFSMTREAAARTHLNHLIHHRGQLTVYLRLVDVPLPPIYGPTADEGMSG